MPRAILISLLFLGAIWPELVDADEACRLASRPGAAQSVSSSLLQVSGQATQSRHKHQQAEELEEGPEKEELVKQPTAPLAKASAPAQKAAAGGAGGGGSIKMLSPATKDRLKAVVVKKLGLGLFQHALGQPPPPEPSAMSREEALEAGFLHVTEELHAISASMLCLVVSFVAAIIYKEVKQWPSPAKEGGEAQIVALSTWKDGVLSCMEKPEICCCSIFCCPIRWADNVSHLGIVSFWLAAGVMIILDSVLGAFPVALFMAYVCTYTRQIIREKFSMPAWTPSILAADCLLYTCCGCLAVAQEARHLEAASLVGHPAIVHTSGKA